MIPWSALDQYNALPGTRITSIELANSVPI
jgi:hypothetical protein